MSTGLSRRKFLHFTGALAAGCYGTPLSFAFPSIEDSDCENANPGPEGIKAAAWRPEPMTACVVGVGDVGFQVINMLRQSSMLLEPVETPQIIAYERVTVRTYNPVEFHWFDDGIDLIPHLDQYHPLFLIGSCDDRAFWSARDFVKSCDPYFLMTCALAKDGQVWPEPSENETIFRFETLEDVAKITRIIQILYAVAAKPGVISIDYVDIKAALRGCVPEIMEYRSIRNEVAGIKEFLASHSAVINAAYGVVCIFCFKDWDSVESQHYEAVIKLISDLTEDGVFTVNCDVFSPIESAFELVMFCQTAKRTESG